MNTLLELDKVSFAYDRQTVVSHVSFTLNEGDYLAIIGENGSGKTTLLQGLLGLKTPSAGVIERSEMLRQRRIGYLPQQTLMQRDFPATVREVILSGRLNRHGFISFYSQKDRAAVNQAMRRLSIETLGNRSFRELSGGQRQRVLLARALAASSGLLLLDEPTAGLDPIVSHEFYRLVRELNRDDHVTVVMVSHDIHCVMHDATHVLHLGREQLFFGTTDDYLKSVVAASYLSHGEDVLHSATCEGGFDANGTPTCSCDIFGVSDESDGERSDERADKCSCDMIDGYCGEQDHECNATFSCDMIDECCGVQDHERNATFSCDMIDGYGGEQNDDHADTCSHGKKESCQRNAKILESDVTERK